MASAPRGVDDGRQVDLILRTRLDDDAARGKVDLVEPCGDGGRQSELECNDAVFAPHQRHLDGLIDRARGFPVDLR